MPLAARLEAAATPRLFFGSGNQTQLIARAREFSAEDDAA
jgi:hypothetical protein